MHSSSVPQFFQQVFGSEAGKVSALSSSVGVSQPERGTTRRIDPVRAVAPKRFARLCLGIGDGSVHRQ
ncbi:hypothetical protein [Dyella psychrodurans]|uniref:Uncharacterized protein n=1 Tax=Dyella psychrodurans TaxID=1927960 RepID=A0A370X6E2_9GAMM|nr:hypothetical protein [Dyella psychrodurans]RDS83999.1 hypothetical protein DWU99_09450 [Dyella psychrodurans]